MHEASIALAIAEEICEQAANANIQRVCEVRVQVGALTSVVPEALAFAWDLAIDGTPAQGAQLRIEHVPLAISCAPCGRERTIESGTLPVCPVCGTSSTIITRGRELRITAMEVIYDAAPGGSAAEHFAQEQHAGA